MANWYQYMQTYALAQLQYQLPAHLLGTSNSTALPTPPSCLELGQYKDTAYHQAICLTRMCRALCAPNQVCNRSNASARVQQLPGVLKVYSSCNWRATAAAPAMHGYLTTDISHFATKTMPHALHYNAATAQSSPRHRLAVTNSSPAF